MDDARKLVRNLIRHQTPLYPYTSVSELVDAGGFAKIDEARNLWEILLATKHYSIDLYTSVCELVGMSYWWLSFAKMGRSTATVHGTTSSI